MVILLYTLLDSRQGGLQAPSFHIQHIMKDAEVALRKHCQLHNWSRSPPYSAACWQGVTASSESLAPQSNCRDMQMMKASFFQQTRRLTWPSDMPASTDTLSVSLSRSNLMFGHSWHSCCVNCWNMPGPSCLVTTLFLQLHFRFPGAGLATGLSRVTCSAEARCERELLPSINQVLSTTLCSL